MSTARGASILERLIEPEGEHLSEEDARYVLRMTFRAEDLERMNALSSKAQEGSPTQSESDELSEYDRVGLWLAKVKSKARKALAVRSGG